LSASPESTRDWIYRVFDRRTIAVKAKNDQVRKVAVMDLQTNVPFAIEVPKDVPLEKVEVDRSYYAALRVYTAQKVEGVPPGMREFFTAVDVDQSVEDFIKAYWLYPKLIKFELAELESL
jgi:hypothetical protein